MGAMTQNEITSDDLREEVRESLKKLKTKDEIADVIYAILDDYALAAQMTLEDILTQYRYLFFRSIRNFFRLIPLIDLSYNYMLSYDICIRV